MSFITPTCAHETEGKYFFEKDRNAFFDWSREGATWSGGWQPLLTWDKFPSSSNFMMNFLLSNLDWWTKHNVNGNALEVRHWNCLEFCIFVRGKNIPIKLDDAVVVNHAQSSPLPTSNHRFYCLQNVCCLLPAKRRVRVSSRNNWNCSTLYLATYHQLYKRKCNYSVYRQIGACHVCVREN